MDQNRSGYQIPLTVFITGFLCLAYELVQVRMLSFFLGSSSNFLAIPIALLGLALGSLYCHYLFRGELRRLVAGLSVAAFPVLILCFIAFFAVANALFPEIHVRAGGVQDGGLRLVTYSLIFLPPYFVFGAIFAATFAIEAERIGRLYFFDLSGAALGCLVTPLLFAYLSLAPVIVVLILAALGLVLLAEVRRRIAIGAVAVVVFGAVMALAEGGVVFSERPDPALLASTIFRGKSGGEVEEVAATWNDLARTSLLRAHAEDERGGKSFAVVQDDGMSNVWVRAYDPAAQRKKLLASGLHQTVPYLLGLDPRDVLVMFAGLGVDMLKIDTLAEHKARITGVEINRDVVDLAAHPALFSMNLRSFLARDGIRLVAREGRDFLNNSRQRYDFIFVAANGAVFANRTGHTRKYLDTYQAMAAYLDHLSEDGVIVFANQPITEKIASFKRLFAERGLGELARAAYSYGVEGPAELHSLVVRPAGLSPTDVNALEKQRKKIKRYQLFYRPEGAQRGSMREVFERPRELDEIVTDDQPFTRKVELAGFSLFPGKAKLRNHRYAANWMKVFTIVLFSVLVLGTMAAMRLLGGRGRRVPFPWLAYFLLSGVSYMCIEVGLMAKTELFMGSPLYAVAIILAFFLLFNSLGSYLQDRLRIMRGPKTMLALPVAAVAWSILLIELYHGHLLSAPLPLKILLVAVCVLPVGTCLGMYYPLGVAALVAKGYRGAVPATYGAATLSSVLGSAAAMTAIVNFGFNRIILAGAVGYLLVALICIIARRTVPAAQ